MVKVVDNNFIGEVETKELVEILRGYALGRKDVGDELSGNLIDLAATRIEELSQSVDEWIQIFDILNDRENRHHYLEYWRQQNGESDLAYPDGDQIYKDFFAMKDDRDHLLKIAKKMHLWMFHHTCDEYAAYKECGLTDEDDARLGYGGQFVIEVNGESK